MTNDIAVDMQEAYSQSHNAMCVSLGGYEFIRKQVLKNVDIELNGFIQYVLYMMTHLVSSVGMMDIRYVCHCFELIM